MSTANCVCSRVLAATICVVAGCARDLLCIKLRCVYHHGIQDNDRSMRHARINGLYAYTYTQTRRYLYVYTDARIFPSYSLPIIASRVSTSKGQFPSGKSHSGNRCSIFLSDSNLCFPEWDQFDQRFIRCWHCLL